MAVATIKERVHAGGNWEKEVLEAEMWLQDTCKVTGNSKGEKNKAKLECLEGEEGRGME